MLVGIDRQTREGGREDGRTDGTTHIVVPSPSLLRVCPAYKPLRVAVLERACLRTHTQVSNPAAAWTVPK